MDISKLKKFAQFARRSLIEQVQTKLKLVLAADSPARREYPKAIKELEQKLNQHINNKEDEKQLIEQVAYTWFNRFCALRFMDVNQYNRIMVLSPISGQFQPELLAEAKAGHLDDVVFNDKTREKIQGLLSGSLPSRDGQAEAYRMMIVAVCNDYHRLMPYLFQRIEDYTELLMPDDLLSGNSILAYTREAMTPENCESVESIGWLYQFYISEKKDLVFEGLKKNKKITPENIPAATQLFTPHWIVKYLVENSLGRLWMLNNPNSKVIEQMEYYIKPVQDEADFLRINTPEEIKLCDSAVGSGHMLTYAYDLLYAIYLEANYDAADIPELILTKNLYGIEIDERAAELAAFALSMKAIKGNPADDSNNRRRFFRNPIEPNICRLEKVKIDEIALEEYIEFAGRDLFTQDVKQTLTEFEEADNFGSLIQPTLKNPEELLATLEAKDPHVDLFLKDTHDSILKILKQAKYLSPIYQVVTANPPYMGLKGMNARLKKWSGDNFKNSKSDLYAMFIERNIALTIPKGFVSMITMQSWMYISSYEKLRKRILENEHIASLLHLGTRAFDSISGEVVSTVAFVIENFRKINKNGCFINVTEGKSEKHKKELFFDRKSTPFLACSHDFEIFPRSPIEYSASEAIRDMFAGGTSVCDIAETASGLQTNDNGRFIHVWWECSYDRIGFNYASREETEASRHRWYPHVKGGAYRKWYGNYENVVNWENNGEEIIQLATDLYKSPTRTAKNLHLYFNEGLTWTDITKKPVSIRIIPKGFIFDTSGPSLFSNERQVLLSFLNSNVVNQILKLLCPNMHYLAGDIAGLPFINDIIQTNRKRITQISKECVEISKLDYDESELSWDFKKDPLLLARCDDKFPLRYFYNQLLKKWSDRVERLGNLEAENDLIFSRSLGVNIIQNADYKSLISLNCNPSYRFDNKNSLDEQNQLIAENVVSGFISYAVGCMFGRYSIDLDGLILSGPSDTLENYLKKVPSPSFMPDDDNVIPIIDFEGDWFEDDITERFKIFLKVTFGEENFAKNLAFIEEAIGKDIKKYFVKDFYADHVKRYKKRPIYWMFSSPNGSFNALIYMHRYEPDTASIVLNDYLREFRTKLEARKQSYEQVEISASASQKEKTQAIKAIAKINKVLEEINDFEHDVLYPLAGEKREIDLDDGVKHNYPLFGKALKKITGLS